ncbi:MAG TPA: SBBP repeat-containing protein, partial [Chitinophagales bacterium]|nr:SBBP repeat-containing protein [Chitinophagales bacterium]
MKSRTIFLLSLSLSCIFLSHSLFAQTVAWTDTYNGTTENEDRGNAAVLDATGNLYTTGYSFRADNGRDIVAVKYTPTGSVSWQRTFNTGSDNTDEGKAIALDANGNVFVAGLGDRNML